MRKRGGGEGGERGRGGRRERDKDIITQMYAYQHVILYSTQNVL